MPDKKDRPSRRAFLKSFGAAALGVPFLLNDSRAQTRGGRARRSCIVVGAGLSGLAAAYA